MAGFLLAAPSAVARSNGDGSSDGGPGSTLRLRLDPDVEAAGKARQAIERLEERLGRELLQDIHLLVTELVTNSVRHANAAAGEPVDVEVSVRGDHVFLAVEDGGSGFKPQPRSAHSPRDSGWGLHLVERLSSRWGVSGDGRTRVWLELARRGRVEAA
jgi:anti-sigma regulatory factor (Ser/Thr protein kinase)